MAYNNGFPMNYQPMYPQYNYASQIQQQQTPQPQQNNNDINWVQGEAGAKSWLVAPGKSVLLMDSESSTFYIKSTDVSGMPMPLRIFDYKERTMQQPQAQIVQHTEIDTSKFVTWDALEKKLNSLMSPRNVEEVVVNE